jgi:uncharacterized protein YdaU (DUF1376 family)
MRDAPHPFAHNGPPVIDSAADLPEGLPKMHYFKCDIEALWNVLVELPFDVGGFYMRALLAMYKHMEGLPADDNVARMRLGGMDIRTYRRMKAILLAQPKCFYEKPSGRVSNPRFEEEISSYVIEFRNRQNAAKDREAKKRDRPDFQPTSGRSSAEVQPKSGGSRSEVPAMSGKLPTNIFAEVSEKPNKINGNNTTIVAERAPQGGHEDDPHARVTRVIVRDRDREERKEESLPLQQVAAPDAAADEFSILNGTTEVIASFIGQAANVPPVNAKAMLRSNIQIYGGPAVNEAYALTIAQMAAGPVANPYRYFLKTAEGIRDKKSKSAAPAKSAVRDDTDAAVLSRLKDSEIGRKWIADLGEAGALAKYRKHRPNGGHAANA